MSTTHQQRSSTNLKPRYEIDKTKTRDKMTAPYPTRASIHALFQNMETGNAAEVFKRVSPDVDWTVMGTHPCAGRYTRYAMKKPLSNHFSQKQKDKTSSDDRSIVTSI